MKTTATIILTIMLMSLKVLGKPAAEVESPDGKLQVKIFLSEKGSLSYTVVSNSSTIIKPSQLGLRLSNSNFYDSLSLIKAHPVRIVTDRYELLTGKRRHCTYKANELLLELKNSDKRRINIVFRVSNDGVAFRYQLPETSNEAIVVEREFTSFHFPIEARAWLHPHADARTGWSSTQPSYEENYFIDVPVGTAAPQQAGWSFPALFFSGNHWVLITETNVRENYCGSRLSAQSPDGEYAITFPQSLETTSEKAPVYPTGRLPMLSPWRVIIVGETLGTIVESTITTDLADKAISTDFSFIKPGQAAWSWVLLKDDSTIYSVQKRFIEFASQMHWRYCLIDAYWDKQIGYEKIQELVDYGKQKNVKILLWYNSAGDWNTAPLTPRNLMFDRDTRRKEFEKISRMGVAGVKVDFFGGDGQSMMAYYQDILKDALEFKLLVNFHGATIPRGWNRTFPNLMTMEAVKGFEFVTFEQANADKQPEHCTVLPFTRNVVGPMDFTPVAFSEVPNIKRITSNAFELALSILFQSGIQHFAEIPQGMAVQPTYVKHFMSSIPEIWEDIKFVDGIPGKYVVLARKGNGIWYIAGINAQETEQPLTFDLRKIDPKAKGITIITDGENNRTFHQYKMDKSDINLIIKPRGGFVAVATTK
ncbi:MAG: glycoside hydrolase family 97 protein [Bacteroidales bacterium]|nr:glycoside hydrolase family 97 protein [Bacteroidales bacterium]